VSPCLGTSHGDTGAINNYAGYTPPVPAHGLQDTCLQPSDPLTRQELPADWL
jgi:hypothetical protein